MRGAITSHPMTPSWRSVQLKHRINFTVFLLYFTLPFLYTTVSLRS